jgi:cytochrome c551/c552
MSTWSTSVVTWRESVYTFSDFSVAYELSQVGGTYTKRYQAYDDLFRQRPDKKKRVIELIMKVKSNKYKERVEIPMNAKVALSDIDLVIQEVLNKPTVNINVA